MYIQHRFNCRRQLGLSVCVCTSVEGEMGVKAEVHRHAASSSPCLPLMVAATVFLLLYTNLLASPPHSPMKRNGQETIGANMNGVVDYIIS